MQIKEEMININPLALLAAVLFTFDETEKVKIKTADSGEEIEVDGFLLGIEKEAGALVAVLPIEKILYFAKENYNMQLTVKKDAAIITFEKQSKTPTLVASNGAAISSPSVTIDKLLSRFKVLTEPL